MKYLLILLAPSLLALGYFVWRVTRVKPASPRAGIIRVGQTAEDFYRHGMECKQGQHSGMEYPEARRLFKRAAELGHRAAMFEYAHMLERGLGGPAEEAQARHYYERAAQAGELRAQLLLGERYSTGEKYQQNLQRAGHWLQQAALSGDANALFAMGRLCLQAQPPLRDPHMAHKLLSDAAALRHPAACFALSGLFEKGDGGPRDLAKSDLLLQQAAELGVAEAQLKLAKHYLAGSYGHIFPQDYRQALHWFKRAAANGSAEAEYEVGLRYELNEGVDQPDTAQAALCYLKAAESGYAPAQYRMGQLYLYGQNVPQNPREARRWFDAAASQGMLEAVRHVEKLSSIVLPAEVAADETQEWKD